MKQVAKNKDPEFSNVVLVLGIAIAANILSYGMGIDMSDTAIHIKQQLVCYIAH